MGEIFDCIDRPHFVYDFFWFMGIGFLSFCEQLEVFREHGLSVPLGTYVGVELVGDMALCLTF